MPRYFFDTIDDGVLTTDSTGVMLAHPGAARSSPWKCATSRE